MIYILWLNVRSFYCKSDTFGIFACWLFLLWNNESLIIVLTYSHVTLWSIWWFWNKTLSIYLRFGCYMVLGSIAIGLMLCQFLDRLWSLYTREICGPCQTFQAFSAKCMSVLAAVGQTHGRNWAHVKEMSDHFEIWFDTFPAFNAGRDQRYEGPSMMRVTINDGSDRLRLRFRTLRRGHFYNVSCKDVFVIVAVRKKK